MADYTITTNIIDGASASASGSGGMTITASVESGVAVTANLSTTGVRGLQGPQGETGAQGPQGDVGPQGPPGLDGNMAGPETSTDNAIVRFNGTTGATVQDSAVIVDDAGAMTGLTSLTSDVVVVDTINEKNASSGVVIDGAFLKDGRVQPRVSTTASAASITPDISANDQYHLFAQAEALTINAPIGSPVNGDRLLLRIKDNGTARAITWNAIFRAVGVLLPTTTVINTTVYVGCIYNATDTKWDCIAVAQEA